MKPAIVGNFVFFNAVWFACVLGAAAGNAWIGLLALAAFATWQIGISPHRLADIRLALIAGLIGFIVDTGYAWSGLVQYADPAPSGSTAPWWIVALWMNFALALNHSLKWLQPYPLLAAAFGLIGGPLAYYGGIKLGAVFPQVPLPQVMIVFGLAWAVVTPLFTVIALWTRTGSLLHQPQPD